MEGVEFEATLLFVDDEENILRSLKRLFRPLHYRIFTASGGALGLEVFEEEQIDLVISDMRMPAMDGAAFLKQVAARWPDAIRILLTGYADMESTIRAVNEGHIYRYVSKPWQEHDLILCVKQALERKNLEKEKLRLEELTRKQNEALTALNADLEKKVETRTEEVRQTMSFLELAHETLKKQFVTSVKVFANLIDIREGNLAGHSKRVSDMAKALAVRMKLSEKEVDDVYFAALLHDIGKIGLPDHLLKKAYHVLNPEERAAVEKHSVVGQAALMALEPLQTVAAIIRAHHERYDGKGYPDGLQNKDIPLGARILAVVNDYDALQIGTLANRKLPEREARTFLVEEGRNRYDPAVIEAFMALLDEGHQEMNVSGGEVKVKSSALKNGMVLSQDFVTNGVLILSKGHVLTQGIINKIYSFEAALQSGIEVYIRADSIQ